MHFGGSSAHDLGPYASLDRKYLTFRLADRNYGINMLYVRGIAGVGQIEPVSHLPSFVAGVLNPGGSTAAPVIDLRARLGLPSEAPSGRTCIIVVEIMRRSQRLRYGLLVDAVKEVKRVEADQISADGRLPAGLPRELVLGFAACSGVKILLDLFRLLSDSEIPVLESTRVAATG